ncbi:hypothetical protein ACTQ4K_00210 [Clostridium sporogenes]|uniref:hypothetical protein n=1 Tax=Clostridium sporogenes TaxID=1509 RepID=UPI003F8ED9DD
MKYEIVIEEKVTYQHSFIVETDKGENHLNNVLDKVESDCICIDDAADMLNSSEIKIKEIILDESGQECELEIFDYIEKE